jgi:phage baseplate assembly protein W
MHGGQGQCTTVSPKVMVGNQPVVTIPASYMIAGCAFPPPPAANGPCVSAACGAAGQRHLRSNRHAVDDCVCRTGQGDGAMSEEFIGSGWAFPLRTDATGRIALVSREQEIEESIRLILGTATGERPMRPEFGCAIHDYVFDSADSETAARVAAAVRASLRRWEPRIEVRDVQVSFDSADPSTMYIDIRYAIGETNDPRNLVFPFYVIPPETS